MCPIYGSKQFPSERIRVGVAKGTAVMRDLADKEYKVGPGDSIYTPAGLAGSHEWQVNDSHRLMQFTLDRKTGVSLIDMHEITRMDAVSFASHY